MSFRRKHPKLEGRTKDPRARRQSEKKNIYVEHTRTGNWFLTNKVHEKIPIIVMCTGKAFDIVMRIKQLKWFVYATEFTHYLTLSALCFVL